MHKNLRTFDSYKNYIPKQAYDSNRLGRKNNYEKRPNLQIKQAIKWSDFTASSNLSPILLSGKT